MNIIQRFMEHLDAKRAEQRRAAEQRAEQRRAVHRAWVLSVKAHRSQLLRELDVECPWSSHGVFLAYGHMLDVVVGDINAAYDDDCSPEIEQLNYLTDLKWDDMTDEIRAEVWRLMQATLDGWLDDIATPKACLPRKDTKE